MTRINPNQCQKYFICRVISNKIKHYMFVSLKANRQSKASCRAACTTKTKETSSVSDQDNNRKTKTKFKTEAV